MPTEAALRLYSIFQSTMADAQAKALVLALDKFTTNLKAAMSENDAFLALKERMEYILAGQI